MSHREIEAALRQILVLGITVVLLIPAARSSSVWIGWLPLWLVGMPLVAWCSLHHFQRPRLVLALPRRRRVQARRWRGQRVATAQPDIRRA